MNFIGRTLAPSLRAITREVKVPLLITVSLIALGSTAFESEVYRFNHLSAAEHLFKAKEICAEVNRTRSIGLCESPDAIAHLEKIPRSAPEYQDAAVFLTAIKRKGDNEKAAVVKRQQQAAYLHTYSEDEARERMRKNIEHISNDEFICEVRSGDETNLMSFDYGHFWWVDDGRCQVQTERRLKKEQDERDSNASVFSYWPTTIRVESDMNAGWLPQEERTCQSMPGPNGKVSSISCGFGESRTTHNIPVKFWGGISRNVLSDWKCIRETESSDDQFVCRAID